MEIKTTQDLLNLLKKSDTELQKDPKDYRYIIYVRKSTDDKEHQTRSLPDQISECVEYAQKKGLIYIQAVIQEAESAKEPDIRPKFRIMIDTIKAGKYDGIIAWHPDRLARNMKEAGEIIDLLDKHIIKDLKFVSFPYENSPSGKMFLGIAFIMAKQYSDQLGVNINRGNKRSLEEGKFFNKPKHGYYKDTNNIHRPDEIYFTLIKQAWKMRMQNKKLEEIADYLNQNGYQRSTGKGGIDHHRINVDIKMLSTLFRDPFYAGVIIYGKNKADLTEVIPGFVPMVTVEEFFQVNKVVNFGNFFLKPGKRKNKRGEFLNGLVICNSCGETRTCAVTSKNISDGSKRWYYNFRCDTEDCTYYGNSVRGKVLDDFIKQFLIEHKFTSQTHYSHYVKEMHTIIHEKSIELDTRKRSLLRQKSNVEATIGNTKKYMLEQRERDPTILNSFRETLKENESTLIIVNKNLEEVQQLLEKNKEIILTYEEFFELFDNLPTTYDQIKALKEKDKFVRNIFLNFTIEDKNVLSYQLNPPFDEFIKLPIITSGGDAGKYFEPSRRLYYDMVSEA